MCQEYQDLAIPMKRKRIMEEKEKEEIIPTPIQEAEPMITPARTITSAKRRLLDYEFSFEFEQQPIITPLAISENIREEMQIHDWEKILCYNEIKKKENKKMMKLKNKIYL